MMNWLYDNAGIMEPSYATEVCRFIIDYARENTDFEELYCRIDEKNTASVRLAKKLDLQIAGIWMMI